MTEPTPSEMPDEKPAQAAHPMMPPPTTSLMSEADELPDLLEMTPELAEEEAVRGDVMLRWAAVFLTILFGFSAINDTRTLVHVKSGQQMQASGFVPSSTDAFAFTLEDQTSGNVSWLLDHVFALVYGIQGAFGLSILKAIATAVIAILLSRIAVPKLPTWWNSICCVLAAGAISVDLMPVTDLVTLLGLSFVLFWLHRYQEGLLTKVQGRMLVLFVLWANMDQRAYLGVILVLLFGVGLKIREVLVEKSGSGASAPASPILKLAGFCFLALLVNPSPISSVLSPLTTYTVEYPTMRALEPVEAATTIDGRTDYVSVIERKAYDFFEFAYVCGFSILFVAVVANLLSWDVDDLPLAIALIGFTLLAGIAFRELPAVSLIAAVAAGTAGQRWYRRTFRQDYSTAKLELFYSRAGRAVTVLTMAALAFMIIADQLPTRSPLGIGFEKDLQSTLDSMQQPMSELPANSRILPTVVSHGDLLIWNGHKTYIDSRASLYGRFSNPQSIAHRFNVMRKSLLMTPDVLAAKSQSTEEAPEKPENSVVDENWLDEYQQREIDFMTVRLTPPGTPYQLVAQCLINRYWRVEDQNSSAIVFQYHDPPKPSNFSVRDIAFEDHRPKDVSRLLHAQPKDFYQRNLYHTRLTTTPPLRQAQHFYRLFCAAPATRIYEQAALLAQEVETEIRLDNVGQMLGGPLTLIRLANEALRLEPNNAQAFRLLGLGYMTLSQYELQAARAVGGAGLGNFRYMQAVMAFHQALIREPDDVATLSNLLLLYQSQGKIDLALEMIDRLIAIQDVGDNLTEKQQEQLDVMSEARTAFQKAIEERESQLADQALKNQPSDPQRKAQARYQLARQLYLQGYVKLALQFDEENADLLDSFEPAQLLRGQLLLESGQLERGYEILGLLEPVFSKEGDRQRYARLQWEQTVAMAHFSLADYEKAVNLFEGQLNLITQAENAAPELVTNTMLSLPLVPEIELGGQQLPVKWPVRQTTGLVIPMSQLPGARVRPALFSALALLEAGDNKQALKAFERVLVISNRHPLRPLAELYYAQLAKKGVEALKQYSPSTWEAYEFPALDDDSSEGEVNGSNDASSQKVDEETPRDSDSDASKAAEVDKENESSKQSDE